MENTLPTIILASGSKRRSGLLEMCRIPHKVIVSGVREDKGHGAKPNRVVLDNAYKKARHVSSRLKEGLVIGADTIVFLDGRITGKLKTKKKVKEFLGRLTRRASYVYTGLAVIDIASGRCAAGYARTRIKMKHMGDEDLDAWLRHIGPFDRAGGFSIEGPGSILFPHIEGCYFNILGLPMARLYDLFKSLGYNLLDFMKEG